MKNNTLIVYSHSSYSDVWVPFFAQSELFLKNYKKVIFTDKKPTNIPDDWNYITYSNDMTYSQRMAHCLSKIDTDLFFYHHEDMFLYEKPNLELLTEYENLILNSDIDFIRLLRSTDHPMFSYGKYKTLFPIPDYSQYYFSVQPTICKTSKILKVFQETHINHLREFEIKVQKACKKNNIKGLFHYDNENKRGLSHYDSNVYPYIATAVVKGKWNFKEYKKELIDILSKLNIDYSKRGIYD
jgi:hypothetical protein